MYVALASLFKDIWTTSILSVILLLQIGSTNVTLNGSCNKSLCKSDFWRTLPNVHTQPIDVSTAHAPLHRKEGRKEGKFASFNDSTLATYVEDDNVVVLCTNVAGRVLVQKEGRRETCPNEGAPVNLQGDLDKNRCYSCICKNGYVECTNYCPKVDDCHMIVKDGCCKRCKGCNYKGKTYASHTEWPDPQDPCNVLRCEAGIVTVSNLKCHTPCANPLPPEPGQCCPTCPECKINGQIASDDRDVVIDDPCLKCRCTRGRMVCAKKACPVLQCPVERQHHPPGECCPICKGTRALFSTNFTCTLQTSQIYEGHQLKLDKCTDCRCTNNTSICERKACPILDCAPELQKSHPASCCPYCTKSDIAESRSQCVYLGKVYEDGQYWPLDACSSCKCYLGNVMCAKTKCNTTCEAGFRLVQVPGECCAKCVEVEGVCMVFGDPHYKSFDGKIYTFKGVGRYQLTKDCQNESFSIRVANYPVKNRLLSSTITRRVAISFGDIRLNLQQKGRVKYNGRILDLKTPFKKEGKFRIKKTRDNYIEITLQNDVKLLWNGYSFLEVTVPATYKKKLCGLCGNFNGNVQDDLISRTGQLVTDNDILSFGSSWCMGKKSDCAKKIRTPKPNMCTDPRANKCKFLKKDPFSACDSKLSHKKYEKACKMDMCQCPSGKCYCESLMAYSRECGRLGVQLQNWQVATECESRHLRKPKNLHRKKGKYSHEKSLSQERLFKKFSTPSNFTVVQKNILHSRIPLH